MPGPFFVSSGIRTDVTAPAVSEILKEIKKLRDTRVTEDELTLGRDALARSLPASFETSDRAVSAVSDMYVYDLGARYYSDLPTSLATVNTESVLGAARKYFVPARMITVIVGDRAAVEPELRKLNLGDIEFRDADGKLLKK
jgi:zinc protease